MRHQISARIYRALLTVLALVFALQGLPTAAAAAPADSWSAYAASDFGGGSGTEADPYQIATAEQLAKLAADVNAGNAYNCTYFKLENDLDLSAHRWNPIGLRKWGSDGTSIANPFGGVFDGDGHTIGGLYADERTDGYAAGLFGYIAEDIGAAATGGTPAVKNLTVSGATVYSGESGLSQTFCGILAGTAMVNAGQRIVVSNVHVSGTVVTEATNGSNAAGGMMGEACRVDFTACSADVSVSGSSNSGAFVGIDSNCSYTGCSASGEVSGLWGLGGFVGFSTTGTVNDASTQSAFDRCVTDASVTGSDWRVGGFVGYAQYGEYDNCAAEGSVTSTVTGWNPKVGGFAGELGSAAVKNGYFAGTVTSAHTTIPAGGFIGDENGGTTVACLFDGSKNPAVDAIGGTENAGATEIGSDVTAPVLEAICRDVYGGHDYSADWTTDTEPTCTAEGSKSHHCTRCGAKGDVTPVDETDHQPVKTDAKAPTCTEPGNIAYWTCSVCGKIFSDEACTAEIPAEQTVLPALGHHAVGVEAKAPTAAEAGNIAYWQCSVCGKYFSDEACTREITKEDTILPATGTAETSGAAEETGTKPRTSDDSRLLLWAELAAASVFATVAVVIVDKQEKARNGK